MSRRCGQLPAVVVVVSETVVVVVVSGAASVVVVSSTSVGASRSSTSASSSTSGSSASSSSVPHCAWRSAFAASRSSGVRWAPAQGGGPVHGSPSASARGDPASSAPSLSLPFPYFVCTGLPQSEWAAASTSPPAASTAATYSPWLR